MVPLDRPVAEVAALAKRDLRPGDTLDQIGEYAYRAWIMTTEDARAAGAHPCGLLTGATVTAPIPKGALITSTRRGHGHCIAKGADVSRMFAEFFGKETGYCRGRGGHGPTLIESVTYRWRGHSKSDRNRYRTQEEIAGWMARDPIARLTATLIEHGVLTGAEAATIEAEATAEITAAIETARSAPDPDPVEATRDVYAWPIP